MQFLRNAENNSCAHGGKIQMWSPDCEMKKLSLSLPPAFSKEEGLANLHFIMENCLVLWGPENTL